LPLVISNAGQTSGSTRSCCIRRTREASTVQSSFSLSERAIRSNARGGPSTTRAAIDLWVFVLSSHEAWLLACRKETCGQACRSVVSPEGCNRSESISKRKALAATVANGRARPARATACSFLPLLAVACCCLLLRSAAFAACRSLLAIAAACRVLPSAACHCLLLRAAAFACCHLPAACLPPACPSACCIESKKEYQLPPCRCGWRCCQR